MAKISDVEALIKEFEEILEEKIEQLKRGEYGDLDIYTNQRVKDEMGGYISNDTLSRLRESGELPAKKILGKWYYRGSDIRRLFNPD